MVRGQLLAGVLLCLMGLATLDLGSARPDWSPAVPLLLGVLISLQATGRLAAGWVTSSPIRLSKPETWLAGVLGPSRLTLLASIIVSILVILAASPHGDHFGYGMYPSLGAMPLLMTVIPLWNLFNLVSLLTVSYQSRPEGDDKPPHRAIRLTFDLVLLATSLAMLVVVTRPSF